MTTSSTSLRSSASAAGRRAWADTAVRAWWSGRRHGDLSQLPPGGPPPAPLPDGLERCTDCARCTAPPSVVVGAPAPPGASRWVPPGPVPLWSRRSWWPDDALVAAGRRLVPGRPHRRLRPGGLGSPEGVTPRCTPAGGAWGRCDRGRRGHVRTVSASSGAPPRWWPGSGPASGPAATSSLPPTSTPLAAVLGDGVRATTSTGLPALDLAEAVRRALDLAGVELVFDVASCTACGPDAFSYRARSDDGRQALFVWSSPS